MTQQYRYNGKSQCDSALISGSERGALALKSKPALLPFGGALAAPEIAVAVDTSTPAAAEIYRRSTRTHADAVNEEVSDIPPAPPRPISTNRDRISSWTMYQLYFPADRVGEGRK